MSCALKISVLTRHYLTPKCIRYRANFRVGGPGVIENVRRSAKTGMTKYRSYSPSRMAGTWIASTTDIDIERWYFGQLTYKPAPDSLPNSSYTSSSSSSSFPFLGPSDHEDPHERRRASSLQVRLLQADLSGRSLLTMAGRRSRVVLLVVPSD